MIERLYVCDRDRTIQASELPLEVTTTEPIRGTFSQKVRAFEKALLRNALEDAGGNQREAAEHLGMTYDQFRHHYKKYGLGEPEPLGLSRASTPVGVKRHPGGVRRQPRRPLHLLFQQFTAGTPLASRCGPEVETPPPFTEGGMKMSGTQVAAHSLVRDTGETIVALRREAAVAVARQRRLQESLLPERARADAVEDEARRALARGEELLARQVLARGLCTLETRRQLERELDEARRHVARLLATLVRAENRAWGLR